MARFRGPGGLSLINLEPKFKKGGRGSRKSKVGSMANNLEHGRQILLESRIRILGEPLRWQTLGCDPFRKVSINLDSDFEDEMGEGGQAGNPILEGKARTHREDAKINLLEVKPREGICHDSVRWK